MLALQRTNVYKLWLRERMIAIAKPWQSSCGVWRGKLLRGCGWVQGGANAEMISVKRWKAESEGYRVLTSASHVGSPATILSIVEARVVRKSAICHLALVKSAICVEA